MRTYAFGDRVTCNGNPEGTVIEKTGETGYTVRLWQGNRLIGDVATCQADLDRENHPTVVRIRTHLHRGRQVMIDTHTRSTVYNYKHADLFRTAADGGIEVRHGRGYNRLGSKDTLYVGVRLI